MRLRRVCHSCEHGMVGLVSRALQTHKLTTPALCHQARAGALFNSLFNGPSVTKYVNAVSVGKSNSCLPNSGSSQRLLHHSLG